MIEGFEKTKDDVMDVLLEEGSVFVHLDPRGEDVRVPSWLKSGPQLVLQLGYTMAIPIPDLSVDTEGIIATLSFRRTPFTCSIPWESVFAVVTEEGKGMMWPEDLPEEIANEVDQEFKKLGQNSMEDILSGRSGFDADPMHAPSEVRSSITSRPLRLVNEPTFARTAKTEAKKIPKAPRVPSSQSIKASKEGIAPPSESESETGKRDSSHLRLIK